ncbi:hypothetical protein K438DRAFT_1992034 [Mycena galopus ATCC 62051]|nr:hypothetical protein K438DRAFT_1992034 [Mycena galopus ATCC 62051]
MPLARSHEPSRGPAITGPPIRLTRCPHPGPPPPSPDIAHLNPATYESRRRPWLAPRPSTSHTISAYALDDHAGTTVPYSPAPLFRSVDLEHGRRSAPHLAATRHTRNTQRSSSIPSHTATLLSGIPPSQLEAYTCHTPQHQRLQRTLWSFLIASASFIPSRIELPLPIACTALINSPPFPYLTTPLEAGTGRTTWDHHRRTFPIPYVALVDSPRVPRPSCAPTPTSTRKLHSHVIQTRRPPCS